MDQKRPPCSWILFIWVENHYYRLFQIVTNVTGCSKYLNIFIPFKIVLMQQIFDRFSKSRNFKIEKLKFFITWYELECNHAHIKWMDVADDMDKTVVKKIFFFEFFVMIQSDAPTNYHFGQSNLSEFLIFGIFFWISRPVILLSGKTKSGINKSHFRENFRNF